MIPGCITGEDEDEDSLADSLSGVAFVELVEMIVRVGDEADVDGNFSCCESDEDEDDDG